MPFIVGGFSGTLWGTKLRKVITSIATSVAALAGAVVGIAQAAPIVEPWWYSSHGWVRGYQAEQTNPLIKFAIKTQLDVNEEHRQRLLKQIKNHELEMQSDQAKTTPQYKALLQDSIDRASATLKTLDQQDKSLFGGKLAK